MSSAFLGRAIDDRSCEKEETGKLNEIITDEIFTYRKSFAICARYLRSHATCEGTKTLCCNGALQMTMLIEEAFVPRWDENNFLQSHRLHAVTKKKNTRLL